MMTDYCLQFLLLVLVSLCALTDLSSGKIPNIVVLPTALIGMLVRLTAESSDAVPGLVLSVIIPFLALYPFWKYTGGKGIGAGDIKLLLAVSILSPAQSVPTIYFISFLSAGIFGIIRVWKNRMKPGSSKGIHMAVFIAGAAGLHILGMY